MERGSNQRSLKELIQNWLQTVEDRDGYQEARISKLWKELMGPAVDHHTKRLRFKDGVLTVHLGSSVLREELSMGRERITQLLNERLGGEVVRKVVLK